MSKPYCYEYPRPAVTVDLVVFAVADEGLRMLLIRRKHDPFAGKLAIPGGFLNLDEPIETAARRELQEETGLADVGQLGFIGYFDAPNRDPRSRTISFAFAATIPGTTPHAQGADDAEDAQWLDPFTVSNLAFDHDQIVDKAIDWLVTMAGFGSGALGLLAAEFQASDLARVCRVVHLEEQRENELLDRLVEGGIVGEVEGRRGWFRRLV